VDIAVAEHPRRSSHYVSSYQAANNATFANMGTVKETLAAGRPRERSPSSPPPAGPSPSGLGGFGSAAAEPKLQKVSSKVAQLMKALQDARAEEAAEDTTEATADPAPRKRPSSAVIPRSNPDLRGSSSRQMDVVGVGEGSPSGRRELSRPATAAEIRRPQRTTRQEQSPSPSKQQKSPEPLHSPPDRPKFLTTKPNVHGTFSSYPPHLPDPFVDNPQAILNKKISKQTTVVKRPAFSFGAPPQRGYIGIPGSELRRVSGGGYART